MDYDPLDRIPNTREVLVAWILCLVLGGFAVAMTIGGEQAVLPAAAAQVATATAAEPSSTAGVRIPQFAVCQADPARYPAASNRAPADPRS
jgi:hypothetical protein